jgi:hypothetical protein
MTLINVEQIILHSDMEIYGDPHGNNVAISCHNETCKNPILLTAFDNQRGNSSEKPSVCRKCGRSYYIDHDRTEGTDPKILHIVAKRQ